MKMKKITKRVQALLLIAVLVFAMTACGKKETIVGTWQVSANGSTEEYVFSSDGTGTHTLSGLSPINIAYTTDGDKLSIKLTILGQEKEESYTYKLDSGKLTITDNGQDTVFNRQ